AGGAGTVAIRTAAATTLRCRPRSPPSTSALQRHRVPLPVVIPPTVLGRAGTARAQGREDARRVPGAGLVAAAFREDPRDLDGTHRPLRDPSAGPGGELR